MNPQERRELIGALLMLLGKAEEAMRVPDPGDYHLADHYMEGADTLLGVYCDRALSQKAQERKGDSSETAPPDR